MIQDTGIASMGAAQAASVSAVCNEMRPCFACALDEFGKETAPQRTPTSERLYQLFSVLLTQYVNTFGAALLAGQGIPMTVLPGRAKQQTKLAVEKYTATEVAGLLRGFGLFYILFKVDAPEEIKDAWWQMTRQLAEWVIKRGYVKEEFRLNFEPSDDEVKINAVCGAALINQAVEENEVFEEDAIDVRCGEPFYIVSRVAPGKLWCLYSPSTGKCAEFGPILVPPAVSNFIKPGWGLDCKFVRFGHRWQISKVQDVLPL